MLPSGTTPTYTLQGFSDLLITFMCTKKHSNTCECISRFTEDGHRTCLLGFSQSSYECSAWATEKNSRVIRSHSKTRHWGILREITLFSIVPGNLRMHRKNFVKLLCRFFWNAHRFLPGCLVLIQVFDIRMYVRSVSICSGISLSKCSGPQQIFEFCRILEKYF